MLIINRPVIHMFLHFLVPLMVALLFFRSDWKKATLLMMSTMLVDIDHLWATPIYMAGRCSIGFHFLHTWFPIVIYGLMLFSRKTRLIALGLVIHMFLDGIDCAWMYFEHIPD